MLRAVRFNRFGGPEVLEIVDLPDPHPGRGQVHLLRHSVVADVEVLEAALGLRPPVPVGRDLHLAQAVELLPHPSGIKAVSSACG